MIKRYYKKEITKESLLKETREQKKEIEWLNRIISILKKTHNVKSVALHSDKEIIATIKDFICEHREVDPAFTFSKKEGSGQRPYVDTRHLICYFIRKYVPSCSLKEIAIQVGRDDHSTTLHALSNCEYHLAREVKILDRLLAPKLIIRID